MKLVLFVQHSWQVFPSFYVAFIMQGYYIEFTVFWRRVGGPRKARKATAWLGIF